MRLTMGFFKLTLSITILSGSLSLKPPYCDFDKDQQVYTCKGITTTFPNLNYGNYMLKCEQCNIKTFSKKTFPYENALIAFNLSHSGLQHITDGAFSNLKNVLYLLLQHNHIERFPKGAFSGLENIFELNLDCNKIKELVPGFLSGLGPNTVSLAYNRIVELPDDVFKGSINLLVLNLKENLIKKIYPNAFAGLDSLENLDLQANQLCHIPIGVFKNLKNLRVLNLANNKLSKMSLGSFSGLTQLNNLILANNSIQVFNGNELLPMLHLTILDVSGNSIYFFDAQLTNSNVPSLKYLHLEDNIFSCSLLTNVTRFFKVKGVDIVSDRGRYDVQNINGVACIDEIITEPLPFNLFMKKVNDETRNKIQDTRLFALSYVNNASDNLVHLLAQCISDYFGLSQLQCTSVTPAGISASEEGKHPRAYRPWEIAAYGRKHSALTDKSLHDNFKCRFAVLSEIKAGFDKQHTNILNIVSTMEDVKQWDFILFNMLFDRLDKSTATRFELSHDISSNTEDSFEILLDFLDKQCDAQSKVALSRNFNLKAADLSKSESKPRQYSTSRSVTSTSLTTNTQMSCPLCKADHSIYHCPNFLMKSPQERFSCAKTNKWCTNCLGHKHSVENCLSRGVCRKCSKKHNTLLHFSSNAPNNNSSPSTSQPNTHSTQSQASSSTSLTHSPHDSLSTSNTLLSHDNSLVLLSTAVVGVLNGHGQFTPVRALIDSASDSNYISSRCANKLGLARRSSNISVCGIGQTSAHSSQIVSSSIRPCHDTSPTFELDFIVLSRICSNMPSVSLEDTILSNFSNLSLADPKFNISGPIDMLLGADTFGHILKGATLNLSNGLVAIDTIFGWMVTGKMEKPPTTIVSNTFLSHADLSLERLVTKFWDLEQVPRSQKLTPEDNLAENHYSSTVSHLESGRFVIALPFRKDLPTFQGTRDLALRRLNSLERRLYNQPNLLSQYSEFMMDYLQILVREEDRSYQKILWRFSKDDPVQTFVLNTVTYGMNCSPFLAIRTLLQLAKEFKNEFPIVSKILETDVYVDDVLSGSNSLNSALEVQQELISLLNKGCFELRKWASNHPGLLTHLPSSSLPFALDSETDSTFIIQQLWARNTDWDSPPSDDILDIWTQFKQELSAIQDIHIPRHIIPESYIALELHGFCDASSRGYSAVIYLRSTLPSGKIQVNFICAKSKVAPLKSISIPRLELCSALLLSELMNFVLSLFEDHITISKVYAWSDSTITLAWINSSPHRWGTFVCNRVTKIHENVPSSIWRHISSQDNPADPASRGLLPSALISNSLWFSGPRWLSMSSEYWPTLSDIPETDEEKHHVTLLSVENQTPSKNTLSELIEKYSSLSKIQRILAYILRFLHNLKHAQAKQSGYLSRSELENSLTLLIKNVQEEEFSTEIYRLKSQRPLQRTFKKLTPFLDKSGVLRVGGRLSNSYLSFSQRHPCLLPSKHRLVDIIIDHTHKVFLHPGAQTLQYLLSQRYWILGAKRAIRRVISRCHTCFRARPISHQPLMGDLPAARISQIKPFSKLLLRMHQDFWRRWHREYLHTLLQRSKWLDSSVPIEIGTLVLLKDELSPPQTWHIGRVECVHPGRDNVTRVVTVRTARGNLKRPVSKCISDYFGLSQLQCTSVTPAGISASEEGKHPRAYRPWEIAAYGRKPMVYLKIALFFATIVSGSPSLTTPTCEFNNDHQLLTCKGVTVTFPKQYYGNYMLKCEQCNIRTFSKRTFPHENALISFNLSHSGLQHLSEGAFSNLENVQYLSFQHNIIDKISKGAFSGLRNVFELNLDYNKLSDLVPGFLSDLGANTVSIANNRIVELPDALFEGSINLLVLNLKKNSIKKINQNTFAGLDSLEYLELQSNQLCHIPIGVFKNMNNLRVLNLANNKVTTLSLGSFSGLTQLNALILANNSIQVFDGNELLPMSHLTKLDISGNSIYYFDAQLTISNVPSLRYLHIEDNMFSCPLLMNVIRFFKVKGVDIVSDRGRYDVQNINGVACIDEIIMEPLPFDFFLKKVTEEMRSQTEILLILGSRVPTLSCFRKIAFCRCAGRPPVLSSRPNKLSGSLVERITVHYIIVLGRETVLCCARVGIPRDPPHFPRRSTLASINPQI
ncbi:hypothetical protein NQ318_002874 [Aromia moschata]|uniref:Uncharacterized protein n=1 Tax=Aromia moschata TaxID=1265417 RepID=A0AAV8Y764_9CUCU|nr:hypothetical protein NQ318_002874 [Aromia moschata]